MLSRERPHRTRGRADPSPEGHPAAEATLFPLLIPALRFAARSFDNLHARTLARTHARTHARMEDAPDRRDRSLTAIGELNFLRRSRILTDFSLFFHYLFIVRSSRFSASRLLVARTPPIGESEGRFFLRGEFHARLA